jgi:hypothetical protein
VHLVHLWPLKKEEIKAFFNTIAQITDDNQKRFIPHLAIETKLFHRAFVNPCMM